MLELINLGINENVVMNILETNPNYKELTMKEVNEKIYLLKNILCTDEQIENIINTNSSYLKKSNTEIIELFNKLFDLGFENINEIIDLNPNVLNIKADELQKYVDYRMYNGEPKDEIITDLTITSFNDLI